MAYNTTLRIEDLTVHKELQAPDRGSKEHVADLQEALKKKAKLPRPKVFEVTDDKGKVHYYPVDGHHTIEAHEKNGAKTIAVELYRGSFEDARVAAAQANQKHLGLKRSHETKRWQVRTCLEVHPEWADGKISKTVGVSANLVADVRKTMPKADTDGPRLGADGKVRAKPTPRSTPSKNGSVKEKDGDGAAEVVAQTQAGGVIMESRLKFDWKTHNQHFGWLWRELENLEKLTGDKAGVKKAKAALSGYLKLAEKWEKKLEGQEK